MKSACRRIGHNIFMFMVIGVLVAEAIQKPVACQTCGCSPDLCCSQYGYCGTGNDFCGVGCLDGPCFDPRTPNNVSVPDIVTDAFFNGIADQANASCAGKGFFTRAAFLEALNSYPSFGRVGSEEDSRREIAAFFAHVNHVTGHLCFIEETDGPSRDYCDKGIMQFPCTPNKGYYGRGPLLLSWNYNYGAAGISIGFDGLDNPEIVAIDNVISFRTSLWFWVNRVQPMLSSGQGFGETIRAINGKLECDGANPDMVDSRVEIYTEYCNQFAVPTGDNLRC